MQADIDARRYPTGKYNPPAEITKAVIAEWIDIVDAFPARLRSLTEQLSDAQLGLQYRPEGWTVRQVVHHVADSHLNSYIRFKWTLTEDNPTIKTYNQGQWAMRTDAKDGPIGYSLDLLTALHARWVYMLRHMSDEDWMRKFYHPELQKQLGLDWLLGLYAWHCNHHAAHIALALENQ